MKKGGSDLRARRPSSERVFRDPIIYGRLPHRWSFSFTPTLSSVGTAPPQTRLWHSNAGVDIFFVISGFIISCVAAKENVKPSVFVAKRLARIVPTYWLYTSLYLIGFLAVPSFYRTYHFDLAHLIRSYLFIPTDHPSLGSIHPVLQPGWTLNYEMYFYFIFAVILASGARNRLKSVAGRTLRNRNSLLNSHAVLDGRGMSQERHPFASVRTGQPAGADQCRVYIFWTQAHLHGCPH